MSDDELAGRSTANTTIEPDPFLEKLHLPTPRLDGETLVHPPLDQMESLWQANLQQQVTANASLKIGPWNLADLQRNARTETLSAAHTYSSRYRDVSPIDLYSNVVMAGHQPELFHPGVWYKNFVLSNLGQQFNCTALNLVVDNDLCSSTSIRVPRRVDQPATTQLIDFDGPGFGLPHEQRMLVDKSVFHSFATRAAKAINPFVDDPLVHRLWPQVKRTADFFRSDAGVPLGASIAAGRHALEAEFGLNTLELPISELANRESFAIFVAQIAMDAPRFREIYNLSLRDYRMAHGLRSRSHPVPELEQRDRWTELPFWVWHERQPLRKRLFVQLLDTSFLLSDGEDWHTEVKGKWAVDDLCEYADHGMKIRPRALMTTMFSRLILSDLFLHGIGGAKYDQLTDLIAVRYFGQRLPQFAALSATMKLPTGTNSVSPADIVNARQTLREMRYQPERFVRADDNSMVQTLIAEKRDWIERSVAKTQLKERQRAIENCNQQLQSFVEPQRRELETEIEQLEKQVHRNQVWGSREFSFCLFPDSLVERLKVLASLKT